MPTLPPDALVESHVFGDTGRGLRCTRDVAEGEELVVVPLDACWHAAGSREVPALRPLVEAGVELTDFDACALHLLVERAKGSASAWRDHLEELPTAYNSTLFWSAAELAELEGSPWKGLAERFAEEAAADWAALRSKLAAAAELGGGDDLLARHQLAWDDYLWAYATLKSRAVEARVDGAQARLMAPGFDLFNHSDALTPGTSHFFDAERRALVAVAPRPYAAGEQAYISYGAASNGSLLLAGGFVPPANRFDHVEVCLTSQIDLPRLTTYMMAAPDAADAATAKPAFEFVQVPDEETLGGGAGGLAPFTTKHLLTAAAPLPDALLTYVRLDRILDDDELAAYTKRADKAKLPVYAAGRHRTHTRHIAISPRSRSRPRLRSRRAPRTAARVPDRRALLPPCAPHRAAHPARTTACVAAAAAARVPRAAATRPCAAPTRSTRCSSCSPSARCAASCAGCRAGTRRAPPRTRRGWRNPPRPGGRRPSPSRRRARSRCA